MLRKLISSKLLAAALLTGSLLCSESAYAACENRHVPQAFSYTEGYPDGSRLIQVHEWDVDFPNKRRLLVYQNGRLVHNLDTGFFSGVIAKGSGLWQFAAPNYNTCGTFTQYTWVGYIRN